MGAKTVKTAKKAPAKKPAKKAPAKKAPAKKPAKKAPAKKAPAKSPAKKAPAKKPVKAAPRPAARPAATTRASGKPVVVVKAFGAALAGPLERGAREAFERVRSEHPSDRFYFFGLFTTADGGYVTATAASEEGLARTVERYRASKPGADPSALARELRFSAPDSPHHALPITRALRRGGQLHAACFLALSALDEQGFFGRGEERDRVIVNVVYGDMSDERWLAHAERLNPPGALAAAKPFLRLNLPSGAVTRWGGRAYQVNALSLSADRQRLAYSGSGGEVGVFDVATKKALFLERRRGQHWASMLAADGRRLYLGDEDALLGLDVASRKITRLARTGQVRFVRASPDGERLVLTTFSSPLHALDASAARCWEREEHVNDAAFSPDGSLLAVTTAENTPRVLFLDPHDGALRAEAPLEGQAPVLAWLPHGRSVLACTSVRGQPYPSGTATVRQLDVSGREVGAPIARRSPVEALAVSPSGARIALLEHKSLVVIDRDGNELARGQGAQESLIDVAFLDERRVVAVGRDVNSGPAVLELAVPG